MMVGERKANRSLRMPVSPGIPGDYFECDEILLVKKLHTLRLRAKHQKPMLVPPLLESYASSSIQSHDDDPEMFFNDCDSQTDADDQFLGSEELLDRIDGEQLSVHSHSSTETVESKPNSWQGSQIVLNVKSFLPSNGAPFKQQRSPVADSRSDSSPRSITKLIESIDMVDTSPRKAHASDMISTFTPATASLSLSTGARSSEAFKDLRQTLPTISDLENDSNSKENDMSALHHQFPPSRRWSFSSSVGGNDGAAESDEAKITQPSSATITTSESQDYNTLRDQELFIKLSEDEDLRDFKLINNFTSDGDYLFSRILRERTRIEMKREMLSSSDKDLYVQTHGRSCVSPQDGNRGIYFSI